MFLGDIEGYYNGDTGTKTVAVEMLQLNLDMISIQSHIALTLLLYAAANRDSIDEFDIYLETYMSQVVNFIDNQFDDTDDHSGTSIPYIFEHR